MSIWPELRASYRATTGRDLAKSDLDEFLEHTLWYMVNTGGEVTKNREALWAALRGDTVEGAEFSEKAVSMIDSGLLDAFEAERTGRV